MPLPPCYEPGETERTESEAPTEKPAASDTMETGSPRKIQFTVPLLDTHLDPEAAEQIRRRRPTPATLVASSDQSSPEIDEDRLPNQLYKAALLNSPRQRRKGQKGTPTMKELQFMVEHHLYRQQQGAGDECSSESCLSDRPSPDSVPTGEELPHDDEATAEAFEKLRCQMEEFSRESLLEAAGGLERPLSQEKEGCSSVANVADPSSQQNNARADTNAAASSASQPAEEKTKKCSLEKEK
ncbi:protein phosphatase 1 regulatory subunit 1A-like [Trachinotus anak]|uniref:protein phosphatase 1 regulatory subunit 1A-like n=1 Tax=Trachinotus anak TaxID=443729 RepID=UPI0039F24F21